MRYGRVPKRSRERGGSVGGGDESMRSPSGVFADGPSTPDSSDSCGLGGAVAGGSSAGNGVSAASATVAGTGANCNSSVVNGAGPGTVGVTVAVRDPESRQLALYDTILTVSQAYHAHCAYIEEKNRNVVPTPINIINVSPVNMNCHQLFNLA